MNSKQKNRPLSTIEHCRILPQAVDAESALLSTLITYGELFPKIESVIRPEDFYNEENKAIFRAIGALYAERSPIDPTTAVEALRKSGELETAGGPACMSRLSSAPGSPFSIEHNANIIRQKSIARKIILSTAEIQARAFDETEDVADIIEACEKAITDISADTAGCESLDMPEAIRQAIDKASQIQRDRQSGKPAGIPTGLIALDREFSGGWRAPDLIIIGARPSMGKTQHALSFAKAASKAGTDVMFASIEMTAVQLINRYFLEDERISGYNLRTGQMSQEEWDAIDHRAGQMWDMKLHIADSHSIRQLASIKSEARRLHRKGKLKLLIIDYLQLIRTDLKFGTRDLEIGYITGELKNMAKELDIPVIVLSQLSRKEKGVKAREPQLEDLRESGNIEQDADIVLFIHKPDYYNTQACDANGIPWSGRGKLIIAKYREGARNRDIIFHHDRRYKKIYDGHGIQANGLNSEEEMPF
ncbi:MAG: replicative DNA helicase [Prevotellaceae bacterium]|jgi:replicative DNA helicase|nr:replicative DNA helicase [Prevotellaceae bacterium]